MRKSPRRQVSDPASNLGGPWLLIGIALVAVTGLGVWGAVRDVRLARRALLSGSLSQIRSHAERTVGGIEAHLEEHLDATDLKATLRAKWLRDYWRQAVERRPERLYAAVVGLDARILVHSDALKENMSLEEGWSGPRAEVESVEAVYTDSDALAGGEPAIDIELPIALNGSVVGRYHVGLNLRWFEDFAEQRLRSVITGWVVVIAAIGFVVAAACAALVRLLRRQSALKIRLGEEQAQRVAERQQLLIGLAHEIRNPLNAIQINLHVLKRKSAEAPGDDGTATMIAESAEEVERIDSLIREVMGLAVSTANDRPIDDVAAELNSLREFVGEMFASQSVELWVRVPSQRLSTRMGRAAFRQVMLNLLENSRHALPNGGRINVEATADDRNMFVSVSDDGTGVPLDLRHRLFEPFFTTRDEGLGLGLAIVRKHLEEAGGSIAYEPVAGGGARFVAKLPLSRKDP
jgi:two-component system sensor histidine kinase HydH